MSRRQTKLFMGLLSAASAAPVLTDWISCTTPPVRDGHYDMQHADDNASPFRAEFRGGAWLSIDHGRPLSAVAFGGYKWRGVLRWVLVHRNYLLTSRNIYVKKLTVSTTYWGGLQEAKNFPTKEAAERYRDRGSPFGSFYQIEAVMP